MAERMIFTSAVGAQLRLEYDVSNYADFTVGSGGDLTIAPQGGDTAVTGTLTVSGALRSDSYVLSATGVTTGADPGDVIIPNNRGFRAVNAAGTTALRLMSLDTSNRLSFNMNGALLNLVSSLVAGSATAGAGSALPATPSGYLRCMLDGTTEVKIPYYAA